MADVAKIKAIMLGLGKIPKKREDESDNEDDLSPGLVAMSEEALGAMKRGDAEGFARALKTAVRMAKD